MRPVWTGALTFGLVNIPVRLHSAVQAKERVSFRLLHKEDLSPIRYDRVCQEDGEVVDWKDIVKGYEYSKGKFVVMTDDDFKAAAIDSAKTIDVIDFVRADEIDPRYFETPYYIAPAKGGEKAYALLREAIKESGMVGIGKITMRTNSLHLAGVKAVGDALVLEIMRFADEIVDVGEFSFPSVDGRPSAGTQNGAAAGRELVDDVQSGDVRRRLSSERHEDHSRQNEREKGGRARTAGA